MRLQHHGTEGNSDGPPPGKWNLTLALAGVAATAGTFVTVILWPWTDAAVQASWTAICILLSARRR